MFADVAYNAGQLIGLVILALVIVGVVRTFSRDDLTLREKILDKRKPK